MGVSLLVGISIDYYTWETSVYVEITNFTGHHIQRLLYWESVILSVLLSSVMCIYLEISIQLYLSYFMLFLYLFTQPSPLTHMVRCTSSPPPCSTCPPTMSACWGPLEPPSDASSWPGRTAVSMRLSTRSEVAQCVCVCVCLRVRV